MMRISVEQQAGKEGTELRTFKYTLEYLSN